MLIDYLILKVYSHMKEERTLYGVFHLLKGKQSIQTVQDAHLYNLTAFYGIYKDLTIKEYNLILQNLIKKQFIEITNDSDKYIITHKGREFLTENKYSKLKFYGMQYNNVAPAFYKRLLLFIQVWTNSNQKSVKYVPIVENIYVEDFIKRLYKERRTKVKEDIINLYSELSTILKTIPDKYALIYVERLTGYKYFGLSIDQLSQKYKLSRHTVELIITYVNHQIIFAINENELKYKLLRLLVRDIINNNHLTISASKTYQLFKQNKSLQDIANIRNLKLNTIYDHIIEIALYDINFKINKFVTNEEANEIINYVETFKTFKLKEIKENISEHITYFQIRLVLATLNL